MNGALMKASSRFAIAAALGMVLGASSVRAADLGGNCCADLEERVAELEATAARKGNRKMSLTITGQINRLVMWYDDGHSSQTYYGLDNRNTSSRLLFLGSAKVNPYVSMGFEIMIDTNFGGVSSSVSQLDEDGTISSSSSFGIAGTNRLNGSNNDAYFAAARRVAWWIEHKDVGKLTVGRYDSAGVIQTIDLGGIGMIASPSFVLLNGGFFIRGPQGQFYTTTWASVGDPASAQGRSELVRYDSPSWNGFIYSASVGEAGDHWGTMLRYAGEFSGVRIAAGIGYESVTDKFTTAALSVIYDSAARPSVSAWGGGLSLMHVPTGLFAQGHYNAISFSEGSSTDGTACSPSAGAPCTSAYWGQTTTRKEDATHWLVQAGIAKNWFGIGNTALYGEYGKNTGWGASWDAAGRTFAATDNFTAVNGVIATEEKIWGLGITQNVDAAASTLYLGYRHFEADITCRSTATNCGGAGSANGTVNKLQTEDIHVIAGGAVVRF